MARIFVSYRRDDSADVTGRIRDRLVQKFGDNTVFTDVDSIPLGVNFAEYIDRKVSQCDVFLAVIGRDWINAMDEHGHARLESPDDFVRIEIESALTREIPVIPVLVRGARMPRKEQLPQHLQELALRNGLPVRADPDFNRDVDRLIAGLEKQIGAAPQIEGSALGKPSEKRGAANLWSKIIRIRAPLWLKTALLGVLVGLLFFSILEAGDAFYFSSSDTRSLLFKFFILGGGIVGALTGGKWFVVAMSVVCAGAISAIMMLSGDYIAWGNFLPFGAVLGALMGRLWIWIRSS